jgi:hypothetical protein
MKFIKLFESFDEIYLELDKEQHLKDLKEVL